jgi:hypothetical protein
MDHSTREEMIMESGEIMEESSPASKLKQRKRIIVIVFCMSIFIIVNISLVVLINSIFYVKMEKNKINSFPVDEIVHSTTESVLSDLVSSISHNHTNYCIKQFELPNSNKRISVCLYEGDIRVDIRVFLSNKPTIKGIYLSALEWKEFEKMYVNLNKLLHPLI